MRDAVRVENPPISDPAKAEIAGRIETSIFALSIELSGAIESFHRMARQEMRLGLLVAP
jgi:hypothetical protein